MSPQYGTHHPLQVTCAGLDGEEIPLYPWFELVYPQNDGVARILQCRCGWNRLEVAIGFLGHGRFFGNRFRGLYGTILELWGLYPVPPQASLYSPPSI